jgi:hypothetical protein
MHEQHVLYQAYPQANIKKGDDNDDEEDKNNPMNLMAGLGKKKEEVKADETEEEELKEGVVLLKPLFTFECVSLTENRQITCIDINIANPDLIAVGYGEYDISCIDDSKLK